MTGSSVSCIQRVHYTQSSPSITYPPPGSSRPTKGPTKIDRIQHTSPSKQRLHQMPPLENSIYNSCYPISSQKGRTLVPPSSLPLSNLSPTVCPSTVPQLKYISGVHLTVQFISTLRERLIITHPGRHSPLQQCLTKGMWLDQLAGINHTIRFLN